MEPEPLEVALQRLKGLDGTQRVRITGAVICRYHDARNNRWTLAGLPEGAVIADARYDAKTIAVYGISAFPLNPREPVQVVVHVTYFQHLEIISEVQP